jgi:hypothetical protein
MVSTVGCLKVVIGWKIATHFRTVSGPDRSWGLLTIIDDAGASYIEINLAPGTEISNNEGDYVTKAALELQFLLPKEISECYALSLATLLNDPKMKLLTSADIQPVSFSAADKPVVNDEPAVKPEPQ